MYRHFLPIAKRAGYWRRRFARRVRRVGAKPSRDQSVDMSDTDLNAVVLRRKKIADALSGFETARTALEGELEELALTERVLARLDRMRYPEVPASYDVKDAAPDDPIHVRAMSMLKSFIPGRGE